MKILTKKWIEKYELLRVIYRLKEYNPQKMNYLDVKNDSINNFKNKIREDQELCEIALNSSLFEELYQAQLERDRKALLTLQREVYCKLKDVNTIILGFACKEDKVLLDLYAKALNEEIIEEVNKAKKVSCNAQEHLINEFDFDKLIGELVYEEYVEGENYYINIDGHIVCIENFVILEREDYKINEWESDNPVSLWTSLDAIELYHTNNNKFELHMMFTNGDRLENKTHWYMTVKGSNIKYV